MKSQRFAITLLAALLVPAGLVGAARDQLRPRVPAKKLPTELLTMPESATGRLILKVANDRQAHATDFGEVMSRTNLEVESINTILRRLRLTAYPAINHPPEMLAALEARAADASGREQPYLSSMLHITGPESNLEAAARALNALPAVEWVVFEAERPDFVNAIPRAEPRGAAIASGGGEWQPVRNDGTSDEALSDDASSTELGSLDDVMESMVPGACCLGSTCFDGVEPDDCALSGGRPFPGACTANFCGACCLPSGPCEEQWLEDWCEDVTIMGVYGGDTSTCDGATCPTGACCFPNETCVDGFTEAQCDAILGGWVGPNTLCEDNDCELDCGEVATGDCYINNNSPYCDNEQCCNLICELDPFCCDEDEGTWDDVCAAQANALCGGGDSCENTLGESCFHASINAGCSNFACCDLVRNTPGFEFCEFVWAIECANFAKEFCDPTPHGGGPTPDYEPLQGYLSPFGWGGAFFAMEPYLPISSVNRLESGYFGGGWALELAGEPFTDTNGDGWRNPGEPFADDGRDGIPNTFDDGEHNGLWEAPGGLYGLGDQLLFNDPPIDALGQGNLTRGKTITVAVIDNAYWPNHEELGHVRLEAGQTMLLIPELTDPDHGTACLSIIGAADNRVPGVSGGVTGLVPEATLRFYPMTSAEEGARETTAWVSALAELGPGDVISASYEKVIPFYNPNNSPDTFELIRMGADLGITVCVSAGDDCFNLDGATDQGDSGGFVVGGCSPGAPYYRLENSNFCTNPSNERSNIVHVKAWGANVASAGYGTLQPHAEPNRSYTANFPGTFNGLGPQRPSHVATPQFAGLVAGFSGFAKQFYGIHLMPEQLRNAVDAPGEVPDNPSRFRRDGGFNTNDAQTCGLDIDPDAGPNMIGVYPSAVGAPAEILLDQTVGFVASPNVDDVLIVRGRNIRGNRFSVKGSDNNYLQFEPIFTDRNDGPLETFTLGGGSSGGMDIPEVESITYLGTGDITDMVAVGHTDLPVVNTMIIATELRYPAVFIVFFVEVYEWRAQTWQYTGVTQDPGDAFAQADNGDLSFAYPVDDPSRFVRASDGRILVRLWTLGFPNFDSSFGGGDDSYAQRIDLFNIFVSEEFNEQLP